MTGETALIDLFEWEFGWIQNQADIAIVIRVRFAVAVAAFACHARRVRG
jgi:hypothetical protein